MRIQLESDKFIKVWGRKKDILEIQVSLNTESLPPRLITRVKNAIRKGYYGSGEDSNIGITISSLVNHRKLPYIFCNRSYWTSGLTFYNMEEKDREKIKTYVKSMADIAEISLEMDRYYGRKFTLGERWSIRANRDRKPPIRSNAPVRSEFRAILKGAMAYYKREILTEEQEQGLKELTTQF